MLSLPNSELYIWIRLSEKGKKVAQDIIDLLGTEPSEQCIHQEICELRWEIENFNLAAKLIEGLNNYLDIPEIVLIKATGKVGGDRETLTLKDSRNAR